MEGTRSKAESLINTSRYSKIELAEELGISRPSLDRKLSGDSKWKKLEIYWINKLWSTKN